MITRFRAWSKTEKIMSDVKKIDFWNREIDARCFEETEIEKIELMQSTGLLDKNGQEIFEGDITASGNHPIKGVVEFRTDLGMWVNCLKGYDYYEYLGNVASGIEIISNIHENPELLEVIK